MESDGSCRVRSDTLAASDTSGLQKPDAVSTAVRGVELGTAGSRVLLLFSGPFDMGSGMGRLATRFHALGYIVDEYDICNGSQYDLSDDAVWSTVVDRLSRGIYWGVFAAPPCGSFSKLRGSPGGPPVVRGIAGKDRYGLATNDAKQKAYVRLHNLLAIRAAEAISILISQGGVAALENPARHANSVSIFHLDE